MKTFLTLLLLPLIVLAYFLSEQFYVAANYVAAYALIAIGFASVVYFIYQAGGKLQSDTSYRS